MAHLGGEILKKCSRSNNEEACCSALSSAPPSEACHPLWMATLQTHAERARTAFCASGKRACPFPVAVCDDVACAALWSQGVMSPECHASLARFCKTHQDLPACAWFARGAAQCKLHHSNWYGCASNDSSPTLVEEALTAKQLARAQGQTLLQWHSYQWVRESTGFAAEHGNFVAYAASPTGAVVRLATSASNSHLLFVPQVSFQAIALPILVVFGLVCFWIFDLALVTPTPRLRPRQNPQSPYVDASPGA